MKFDCTPWENKMQKVLSGLEDYLTTIRASLANAGVLSRVTFEYYGAPTKITEMAEVRTTDARTLIVKPYDKSTLKAMEKACGLISAKKRMTVALACSGFCSSSRCLR